MSLSTHHGFNEDDKSPKSSMNQFAPLLIATIGLPGRGKSILAKRLARYLNYTGEKTTVFDVSDYRRKHLKTYGSHDIFRAENLPAWKIRQQSFYEALSDAADWLQSPGGHQVAILDGPNVTRSQRQQIYDRVHGELGYRVMFIECVCDDVGTLERNFNDILQYSQDYRHMSTDEALNDLTLRLSHYKAQYETPSLGSKCELPCPMVKLLDGGYSGVIAHGITGMLESKVLAYVSTPKPTEQVLYFSRHGESEFNLIGRIGGNAGLSPRGRLYAQALTKHVHTLNEPSLQVWTSTLQRTIATSAAIAAPQFQLHALDEVYSGDCENLSYEELATHYPRELAQRDLDKLNYRYPQGESYLDVMRRLAPLLAHMESSTHPVLTVSHQATLRCVLGYFLNTPLEEIPYIHVPLHTVLKVTLCGHSYNMDMLKMPVECVDTNRPKPVNCAVNRPTEEVMGGIPAHYDTLTAVLGNMTQECI